jgi:hypothetical protein
MQDGWQGAEIDWKSVLSPKTDRLAQHLCAFANQESGGFFSIAILRM